MRKRVPAAVLAVLLAWSMAAPARATALLSDEYTSTGTFWQAVAEKWYFLPGSLIPSVIGWVCDDVCSESADHKHHGSLKTYEQNPDKSFTAVCSYCSAEFPVYDADLSAAYDDYVAELPAPGYGSDGSLLLTVPITVHGCLPTLSSSSYKCEEHSASQLYSTSSCDVSVSCSTNSFRAVLKSGHPSFSFYSFFVEAKGFSAPYSGYYQLLGNLGFSGTFVSPTLEVKNYSGNWSKGSSIYYEAGAALERVYISFEPNKYTTAAFSAAAQFYPPVFKYIPTPVSDINFDIAYNITTRPTSITGGNYGIIGDNGQITTVTNNSTIVNETNNTYYNPATGETSTITDWSYDYSDRSYNLTLEGGDTSTVTYGDENITITETTINESGDTIINNYTIYYIIEGFGSGPATHTHDWRETSVTDAACIQAGRRVYTCDVCGDTKSETIPALGHNWLVLRTVNTEYDEDGALVTEGYVLYQCDRCQEQYKTTSTSSRPPPGGGTTSGSGTVLDEFPDFVDMLLEMLQQLPSLFSGFVAFLNAMFAYIPEEIIFLLTFGVAAVVLIGIIKAVRG